MENSACVFLRQRLGRFVFSLHSSVVCMTERIADILMSRDSMARSEAEEMVHDAKVRVLNGEDPEEILYDDFGLEPDYVFELLEPL